MGIVRHTVGKELDPERLAAMKAEIEAAAKRPYTYDPDCPLMTEKQLSEFRPVSFATMEERTEQMKAKLWERGLLLHNSSGHSGRLPGTIEVSLDTARWFADFLNGETSGDTHKADGKMYEAKKDSFGDVTFTEIREGGFASDLVFSSREIPYVLSELKSKMMELERTPAVALSK